MSVKRYTFMQVAKMECAECTTTITTTQQNYYVKAADVEALKAGAVDRVLSLLDGPVTEQDREHARQVVDAIFEEVK